jgi:hypothetical protein
VAAARKAAADHLAEIAQNSSPIMSLPNVLIIGSGEYVSGIVSADGAASSSDKSKGVVALVMFDLRSRKKIGNRIAIAGTCGLKFPHIRQHFAANIAGVYRDMDVTFESFPADDVARKPDSYKDAIATFSPGDLAIIFTPDDSHFDIATACIHHGLHVCVTKPLVQTLQQHRALAELALERRVLSYVEVHKRWDPIYIDARARLRSFGDFAFFQAFMSQPKKQLKTFASWYISSTAQLQSCSNFLPQGWNQQRHQLLSQQPPRRLPLLVHAGRCAPRLRLCQCQHRRRQRRSGPRMRRQHHAHGAVA